MSQAGWYPDPGGQPGMFRYWNGAAWSDDVTPTPGTPSGAQVWTGYPGTGTQPGTQPIGFNNNPYGFLPLGSEAFHGTDTAAPPQRKTPVGAIIAAVAVLAAICLVGFLAVRSGGLPNVGGPAGPAASSTQDETCPKSNVTVTPRTHPADGRVHGGMFSFPLQPSPWSAVQPDDQVPFGADVHEQTYAVEKNFNGQGTDWVASLLVGDLVAGDGFYGPKEGAEIVARCVIGLFYGDNKIERKDLRSEQHDVGGKDGWLIQMHLSFDIKGLTCKGETATIVVASTGTSSASLFYTSIPDTTPQLASVADQALSQLTVGV